jgi:hypothetical protein
MGTLTAFICTLMASTGIFMNSITLTRPTLLLMGASLYIDILNHPETCLAGDVEVLSLGREHGDGSLDCGLEQKKGLVDEVVVCPVDLSKGVSGDHNESEEIRGCGSIPSITRAGILETMDQRACSGYLESTLGPVFSCVTLQHVKDGGGQVTFGIWNQLSTLFKLIAFLIK